MYGSQLLHNTPVGEAGTYVIDGDQVGDAFAIAGNQ